MEKHGILLGEVPVFCKMRVSNVMWKIKLIQFDRVWSVGNLWFYMVLKLINTEI